MSNFVVQVVTVNGIEPIEGADQIELAVIKGYRCVVQKNQYKVGDLAVYIPEQAIVPDPIIAAMNLTGKLAGSKKNRVKAIKLRGCLSQGLLLNPRKEGYSFLLGMNDHFEGQDVAEHLGIVKYEEPIPTHMAGEVYNAGQPFTVAYDIENIKNYPDVIKEGEIVVMTEKCHGCADYDTLIDTLEHGEIKIGDVVRNKMHVHVKSMDVNTGEVQFNLIEGHQELENNGGWYELETEDGKIVKLTGNHPVWLPELNAYRRVDELEGTEKVLIV